MYSQGNQENTLHGTGNLQPQYIVKGMKRIPDMEQGTYNHNI
jgi:hypothetical protein